MTQLSEILTTVRELIFDRFIIPGIALRALPGHSVEVTPATFKIRKDVGSTITYQGDLTVLTTFQLLAENLISSGVIISYTPYFNGAESVQTLIPTVYTPLGMDHTLYRKFFFSDREIRKEILYYYYKVLGFKIDNTAETANSVTLDLIIPKLIFPSERHLCYRVAYFLVEKRRSYEAAATFIGQSYTDGTGYDASNCNTGNGSTTVQIGSVFTLQEDVTTGFFYEDYNRVGSDNTWGDKYSFWFKLMLYLRGKLEEEFGDYSLRPDNIMVSHSSLEKGVNFRSYYDSYPFTLSPLTRGII